MISQERPAGQAAPSAPPSARHPRRLRTWPLVASIVTHGLVLAAAAAALIGPASKALRQPPPAVPVVVLTPPPSKPHATPKPFRGDLAVRAKPTPTPVPTPTPSATPTPKPSATPKPKATPTPRPKATPTPKPKLSKEQRNFKVMRQIPYFKHMTDEQLRQQKLPPGMKDWGEVITMGKKLDGLNWLFLPPETTPEQPQTQSSAPASPAPTPREEVAADGTHTLTFQQEDTLFVAAWKPGDANVTVTYRPVPPGSKSPLPSPGPGEEKTFEVPYAEDREQLLANILSGYVEALFNNGGSPQP